MAPSRPLPPGPSNGEVGYSGRFATLTRTLFKGLPGALRLAHAVFDVEEFMAARRLARGCGLAIAAMLATAGAARADFGLGPADAEKTLGQLRYLCILQSLCPLTAANYATLKGAVAGDRYDEYSLGRNLLLGDGVATDHDAGVAWVATAAEAGVPQAGAISKTTSMTANISTSINVFRGAEPAYLPVDRAQDCGSDRLRCRKWSDEADEVVERATKWPGSDAKRG
jgi:hypothetical protein